MAYDENFFQPANEAIYDTNFKRRLQALRRSMTKHRPRPDGMKLERLLRSIGTWLSNATGYAGAIPEKPELVEAWILSPKKTMHFIEYCIATAADPEARRALAVKQVLLESHDQAAKASEEEKKAYRTRLTNEKTGQPLADQYAGALAKDSISDKSGKPIGADAAQLIANRIGLESGVRLDEELSDDTNSKIVDSIMEKLK